MRTLVDLSRRDWSEEGRVRRCFVDLEVGITRWVKKRTVRRVRVQKYEVVNEKEYEVYRNWEETRRCTMNRKFYVGFTMMRETLRSGSTQSTRRHKRFRGLGRKPLLCQCKVTDLYGTDTRNTSYQNGLKHEGPRSQVLSVPVTIY